MSQSSDRYNPILLSGIGFFLAIGVAALILPADFLSWMRPHSAVPTLTPLEARDKCDALAADLDDPDHRAAPVPETAFAPGPALEACTEAVRLNPNDGRSQFELGRALWLSRHDNAAYDAFVDAIAKGHCTSKAYIGKAFLTGRGLPPEKSRSGANALFWLTEARICRTGNLDDLIEALVREKDRNTFDRDKFGAPDYMETLYENDLSQFWAENGGTQNPIQLAYYMKGVVEQLDHESTLFLDQECRSKLNPFGNMAVDVA